MASILLNLRPEPETKEQAEAVAQELPVWETPPSFTQAMTEGVLEVFNPFEWALEEPRAALILLVLFGVMILAGIALNQMWGVIQGALSSGGPPQGFGLK